MWTEVLSVGIPVLGSVLACTWHLSRILAKIDQRVGNIEKKTSKYDELIEDMVRMRTEVDIYLKKESPLKVTDEGEAFLKRSGARGYIEKYRKNLLKDFSNIHEPFNIQEKAVEIMNNNLRGEEDVTKFVYENGEDMERLAKVAGVALRDIVLKEKGMA